MSKHTILDMLEQSICVSVNSDDPAYVGSYMTDNCLPLAKHLDLSEQQAIQLTLNNINSSFADERKKQTMWLLLEVFNIL